MIASKIEHFVSTKGGTLLDVGCATGELINYLQKFLSIDFTGIDISQRMLDQARLKMLDLKFICQDILTRKYISNVKYDFVVCNGVLSIFDNIKLAIKNLLSCVKLGGILFSAKNTAGSD